ncbi:MAG: hypothetical protein P8Q97_19135 [Myxococcota bacterium]|nr:hypothetical protein [Myxococcota bacterium]
MTMKMWRLGILVMSILYASTAVAEIFGGVDFPDGASSFADDSLRFDCLHSGGPCATLSQEPDWALGPPDNEPGAGQELTLGRGGLVELRFTDNVLTNSGDSTMDLHIFEVGPDVEDTFVAVRPTPETGLLLPPGSDADGDGFHEVGKVAGATSAIDLDLMFTGFAAGQLRFDAVQLIDDPDEGNPTGTAVGADIDAVGAVSSVRVPTVPGLGSIGLFLCGALMICVERYSSRPNDR